MEFLTLLLTGLLGLISPVGMVLDTVVETLIRDQVQAVESLQVRVDNAPSFRVVQGRVERVRIAGRGVVLVEGVRVAAVDVETDAIAANPRQLRAGTLRLQRPLQAALRVVLTQADLERALQSPFVTQRLRNFRFRLPGAQGQQLPDYQLASPQIELLGNQRLRVSAALQQQSQQLQIVVETGLELIEGRQIRLVEPAIAINNQPVPAQLLQPLVAGVQRQLDMDNFVTPGTTARLLALKVEQGQIEVAAFVRISPEAIAPSQ